MANQASNELEDVIPYDARMTLDNPTDDPRVNAVHKNLEDKIHFRGESDLADPKVFYVEKDGEIIPKKKKPYEENGCKVKVTSYGDFGKSQYKWWSDVLLAVRDNLSDQDLNTEFTLFVDFHGGGFTTGDARHGPWRQQHKMELIAGSNVICVCPNYPVLPWFDGSHIYHAIRQFWKYIHGDSFEKDVGALHKNLKFRRTNIIVSGDSAGSWLAMHSFLDPTLGPGSTPLDIAAIYMQYPMLRHYQRDYELDPKKVEEAQKDDKEEWTDEEKEWKSYKDETGVTFMERQVYKKQILLAGAELELAWKAWHQMLKERKLSPFDIDIRRPWAPLGMSAAFLSSHMHPMWKEFFQNGNTSIEYEDIPTRVADPSTQANIRSRQHLPAIYVYHGTADANCPIEDTDKLVATLKQLYNENPQAKSEKVVDRFQYHRVQNETHGWDHQKNVKDLPILVQIHKGLQDNHINKV